MLVWDVTYWLNTDAKPVPEQCGQPLEFGNHFVEHSTPWNDKMLPEIPKGLELLCHVAATAAQGHSQEVLAHSTGNVKWRVVSETNNTVNTQWQHFYIFY